MISSAGNLVIDRSMVNHSFKDIIGAMARKRYFNPDFSLDDEDRDDFGGRLARWMDGSDKQKLAFGLIVGMATAASGSLLHKKSASETVYFQVPTAAFSTLGFQSKVSSDWASAESEFWRNTDSHEFIALAEMLADDASAALERMLPSEMAPDQALKWASDLVASVKG